MSHAVPILDSASVLHHHHHANGTAGYWKATIEADQRDAAAHHHKRRKSAGAAGEAGGGETGSGSVFAPLAPLVRLIRDPAGTVVGLVEGLRESVGEREEREEKERRERRRVVLYARLASATTYADWHATASELDDLEGATAWKADPVSPFYDHRLIETRLRQLDEARLNCDVERMLFLIRTTLSRGLGGMDNPNLYRHAHVGTKNLIERYTASVLATLRALLTHTSSRQLPQHLSPRHVLDQVLAARQAYGRSALLLSGGATFGMYHVGVLSALWSARLLPRIISGASAGAIVAAVLCTSLDAEIPRILEELPRGDLAVFESAEGGGETVLQRVARFLKIGAWIDIAHLTRVMRGLLGDMTFQEAYNRTRRILNICVSSAGLYELPRLLNYITAPNVLIWSAVAASCSVPLVFTPASLLAKHPKTGLPTPWNPSPQRWIDGSVDNDLPMTRLAEMFNVNHFIVSQVNPHVVPFLTRSNRASSPFPPPPGGGSAAPDDAADQGRSWLETLTNLALGETLHRLHTLTELSILPLLASKTRSVLSQRYSGHITILPAIRVADYPRMLSNPTEAFMRGAVEAGERAAWPVVGSGRLGVGCGVEGGLDWLVGGLRCVWVFGQGEKGVGEALRAEGRLGGVYGVGVGRRSKSAVKMPSEGAAAKPSEPRRHRRRPSREEQWEKGLAAARLAKATHNNNNNTLSATETAVHQPPPNKSLQKIRDDTLSPSSSTTSTPDSGSSPEFLSATSSSASGAEEEGEEGTETEDEDEGIEVALLQGGRSRRRKGPAAGTGTGTRSPRIHTKPKRPTPKPKPTPRSPPPPPPAWSTTSDSETPSSDPETPPPHDISSPSQGQKQTPPTPGPTHRTNPFSAPAPQTVPPLLATPPATIPVGAVLGLGAGLSMTPASASTSLPPSSPDSAGRRGGTRRFSLSAGEACGGGAGAGGEYLLGSGPGPGPGAVVVDISGTRGMVLRRKEILLRRGKSAVQLRGLR